MNSSCNLNTPDASLPTLQMVISIPTFILGLVGNVTVLVMFCCRKGKSWSDMMVYITNMALADCTILFSLPFKMYSYQNLWPFSTDFCLVLVSVHYVNMYVSIFTATAISIVRYICVKYPFKAKSILSPLKALVVCILIWVVICSLSACLHSADAPETNMTRFKCFQKIRNEPLPLYFILLFELLGYLLPLVTMTFCSARVICSLSKQTSVSSRTDKIQSIRIIAANLAVFIICFSPFHFGFLLKYLVESSRPDDCTLLKGVHEFTHISFSIANTNCCLDAFSYYFATSDSRKRISKFCVSKAEAAESAVDGELIQLRQLCKSR